MKIIVAIPEQQHAFALISALKQAGFQVTYITTVYFKNGSWMLRFFKYLLPQSSYKRAAQHHCQGVDDNQVLVFYPFLALFQLLMARFSKKIYLWVRQKKWALFNRKLVHYVQNHQVDVLVLYEDYAAYPIEQLQHTSLKILVDCAAASKTTMRRIYEKDSNGKYSAQFKREAPAIWKNNKETKWLKRADYLLVPSEFSKKSYQEAGALPEKLIKIPYPAVSVQQVKSNEKHEGLCIAYSGQITYRKGLHHLLEGFCNIQPDIKGDLFLYGNYDVSHPLFSQYHQNSHIHFKGWLLKEYLHAALAQADVFIFPSLSDSFSFSCLEAMQIGIPIICTPNTGIAEYIDNYQNGILIEPSSVSSIQEALLWAYKHPENLEKIGQQGKITIQHKITTQAYNRDVSDFFTSIIN